MKRVFSTLVGAAIVGSAMAQYSSMSFLPTKPTDNSVFFSTMAKGKSLPILWGLDTAWPDEANMVRGVRYIGAENIGVARVSFQPWEWMLSTTTLTPILEANLVERLRLVSYIGGPGKVQLVLNNDAPDDKYDKRYSNAAENSDACRAYCNLIYGTLLSCQKKGWEVITASPLNEPDYVYNGQGSQDDFLAIAKMLKTEYDQFKDGKIRISGGNTLNCDWAESWYTYLYDYIDEGNTHQLAGDFNHYADFFAKVRADGKYATADELHNVMEAIVGVEYGMQTGIWWGTAELARGEFCKASFGERLAYAENRKAWTSAAVYRAPDGKIQAFVGTSERQAKPCSYRFVSQDRDVFYNGYGPQREFVVETPGGDAYQVGQTNAECVVDITWGEDVRPIIDGEYQIMNKLSRKLLAVNGAPGNGSVVKQYSTAQTSVKAWEIKPTPNTTGGDFSYYTIKVADKTNLKLDLKDWNLNEGADIIIYDGGLGSVEQWYFKYAGDSYFRIFNRHSNLCLQLADERTSDGIAVVQGPESDSPAQLWRLIAPKVMCEVVAPEAPTGLTATPNTASISLKWTESTSTDVDYYVVLRAEEGSSEFNTIARYFKASEFVDNTVEPGKKYVYKLKCIDRACNSSECTPTVTASTLEVPTVIAHYTFNNTLADATDNHFDAATYDASRIRYDAGRTGGSSLKFASNRYVQLPYRVANYPEFTVGAWVNWQTKGGIHTIFDFSSDAEHYAMLYIDASGLLQFAMRDGDRQETMGGYEMPIDKWQYITVTVKDKVCVLYIDGKKVASSHMIGRNMADIKPVINYIGCDKNHDLNLYGLIEDLCIYNFAVGEHNVPSMMQGYAANADIQAEGALVATEYYNMLGVRVDNPAHGVYIVKRIYDDGRVESTKETVY